MNDRYPRRHPFELRLDAMTALLERELQLHTLARSRRRKIAEGLPDQCQCLVGKRFGAQRRLSEHTWPSQDFDDRQRNTFRRVTQHLVCRVT
jgi:hypothetical protein